MRRRVTLAMLLLVPLGYGRPRVDAPAVVAVTPEPNALTVHAAPSIEIELDRDIDSATLTRSHVRVFGQWSGPARGTLEVVEGRRIVFRSADDFFAGERVTVTISRRVGTIDGTSLAGGYAWSFRIRAGPGVLSQPEAARFFPRDVDEETIQIYGAYAGDIDDDGWSDLAIVNERADDIRLYLNDGMGGYAPAGRYPLAVGTFPSPSEGTDLDADGVIDLVVGGAGSDRVDVLMGDGLGGFQPRRTYRAGRSVRCLAVLDIDGDADPDVVTGNRGSSDLTLLINDGDGTLSQKRSYDPGLDRETGCAAGDADGDGLTDLFVASLRGREIAILLSDGEGNFTLSSRTIVTGSPWMLVTGDVDGDGHIDVVSANSSGHDVTIAVGDGRGGFRSVTSLPTGRRPLAVDLGDLDGDGDLDLVSSNYDGADFWVFENDGRGGFTPAAVLPAAAAGSCVVLHDRDNDGDLDITGVDEVDDVVFLFENRPR